MSQPYIPDANDPQYRATFIDPNGPMEPDETHLLELIRARLPRECTVYIADGYDTLTGMDALRIDLKFSMLKPVSPSTYGDERFEEHLAARVAADFKTLLQQKMVELLESWPS